MQRDNQHNGILPENQLMLYISDRPPGEDWQQMASQHGWEVQYQNDLHAALGAFIMLMPGIVIIDRSNRLGKAALSHIEDVLYTTPQPLLILVELGVSDCMSRHGSVIRLGAAADVSAGCILSRLWDHKLP